MNVAFLYPGNDPHDALVNWVNTLARHVKGHRVLHLTSLASSWTADVVLLLTQGEVFSEGRVAANLVALQRWKTPFAVVHNQDNPPVPAPGDYPSFCWTEMARKRLRDYHPILLRQPALPACMEPRSRTLHVGTFGHIEPKKATLQMARWAQREGLPFTALAPDVLADLYADYIEAVRKTGARVVIHPWAERIEDLAPLLEEVTHLLFVLPPGKAGTGGSPTSPRYATAFNRPVIVVDDEDTMVPDGVLVLRSLSVLRRSHMNLIQPPLHDWTPEEYVDALVRHTLEYHRA